MATCDRCNTSVETGRGYLVFSEAAAGVAAPGMSGAGGVIGTLLLCEKCAKDLFTNDIWADAKPTTLEVDPSAGTAAANQARRQVIDFSIAIRAKVRGLNAAQAREEARKNAQLRWTDHGAAERQLLAQTQADCVVCHTPTSHFRLKTYSFKYGERKGQYMGQNLFMGATIYGPYPIHEKCGRRTDYVGNAGAAMVCIAIGIFFMQPILCMFTEVVSFENIGGFLIVCKLGRNPCL